MELGAIKEVTVFRFEKRPSSELKQEVYALPPGLPGSRTLISLIRWTTIQLPLSQAQL
jgi:hypothetical protein